MSAAEHFQVWASTANPSPERLVAFQRWLANMLQDLLVWPRDPESQSRQIGQCRSFIERAVADLDRHGFLFEAEELARLLTEQLEYIASYQKEGGIRDIYKYLERSWDNWVGKQAEELAAAARMAGVHRSQVSGPRPPSMPELVRRNLEAAHEERKDRARFRRSVQRARKQGCKPSAHTYLPGFEP